MRSHQLLLLFLFPCFLACEQVQEQALLSLTSTAVTGQSTRKATAGATNIVFQSKDDGQSWQDISAGLPEGFNPSAFFAGNGELFLGASNGLYRNSTASKTANWKKEMSLEQTLNTVSAGMGGVIAFSSNGRFFQKVKGTGVWMPIFTDFKRQMVHNPVDSIKSQMVHNPVDSIKSQMVRNPVDSIKSQMVRNVFTTKDGSVFIGCDDGLFKSTDQGKTWKHVMQEGVIEMVESDGVLLCTSQRGILRSTDGGEHWDVVISEGGVGIAVEVIKGGFAAITYNTRSETRRIRTSIDGGKTWQPIDAGLPPSQLISSIQQLGDYFYCGHPKGIYRSADQGKTWNLLRPTIGEKVFNLSVSDGVLYAVLRDGGC